MRKTTIALLSIPPAIAVTGLATGLDGLASLGVIATVVSVFAVRAKRSSSDVATRRASSLALAAGWAVMTAVDLRNPGVALSHVLGIATWKVAAAVCAITLIDASGLPDRIGAMAGGAPRGTRTTES